MYVAHSGWIQSEIKAAKDFRKPIIAVQPLGSERFPEAVTHAADERVGWNTASIISAILRKRDHVAFFPSETTFPATLDKHDHSLQTPEMEAATPYSRNSVFNEPKASGAHLYQQIAHDTSKMHILAYV
jgi:predicted DNA-binding transcriptional regulator AlpA